MFSIEVAPKMICASFTFTLYIFGTKIVKFFVVSSWMDKEILSCLTKKEKKYLSIFDKEEIDK